MDMFTLWMLLAMIVGAVVCYVIASRNQLSTIWWPMFGFILPLVGIVVTIIVAVAKSKKSTKQEPSEEIPAPAAA